jgi:hypothetical protein
MNKKLLTISISVILMLITISFTFGVTSRTTNTEVRESPLYRVRILRSIGEDIGAILKQIKISFINERLIWLPFRTLENNLFGRYYPPSLKDQTADCPTCNYETCDWHR